VNDINEMWPEDWPMSAVNEAEKLEDKIDNLKIANEALERELAEARDNDAYFCGVHAERARCIKAVVDEPEPDRPTPAVATITRAVKANILARINAQGGEVQSE